MTLIGQWVQREVDGTAVSRAHLVESEIEERVVLRCGKQMHRQTRYGRVSPATDAPRCFVCAPKEPG